MKSGVWRGSLDRAVCRSSAEFDSKVCGSLPKVDESILHMDLYFSFLFPQFQLY